MNLSENLFGQLQSLSNELDETIRKEWTAGIELAEAEAAYNIAVNQEALRQKDAGMTVTFINSFIKGVEAVATLRKQRDIAEVKYKTLQDKANSLKLQLRIVDNQINREWSGRYADDPV